MTRNQSAATSPKTARGLPTGLLLWLSCGTVGSLLFMATYLIEGATRPGYNAWQQAISALSLGPDGWVQQVNFVAFGAITVSTAIGWRQFLTGGMGATWYPILRSLEGLALIVDGFFSQDPPFTRQSIKSSPSCPLWPSQLAFSFWPGASLKNLGGAAGPHTQSSAGS